jgi:hypothetical protein
MNSKFIKMTIGLVLVAIATAGFVSTASARLINQQSLGNGIKCFATPVTQPDGSVVYTQICRKVGV